MLRPALDLSAPKNRGLLNTELFQRTAICCAAGALCSPMYCTRCRGVQRLQMPKAAAKTAFVDESEALRWICVLLDRAAERAAGVRDPSPVSVIDIGCPQLFETPLSLAAEEGRYRILLELMKRGASAERISCGALQVVEERARSPRWWKHRMNMGVPVYEDILTLLAMGYRPCDDEAAAALHEIGILELNVDGFLPNSKAKRELVWDGSYHRLLLTSAPDACPCSDEMCAFNQPGGWRALTSMCIRKAATEIVAVESPLEDNADAVEAFLRKNLRGRQREGALAQLRGALGW